MTLYLRCKPAPMRPFHNGGVGQFYLSGIGSLEVGAPEVSVLRESRAGNRSYRGECFQGVKIFGNGNGRIAEEE